MGKPQLFMIWNVEIKIMLQVIIYHLVEYRVILVPQSIITVPHHVVTGQSCQV